MPLVAGRVRRAAPALPAQSRADQPGRWWAGSGGSYLPGLSAQMWAAQPGRRQAGSGGLYPRWLSQVGGRQGQVGYARTTRSARYEAGRVRWDVPALPAQPGMRQAGSGGLYPRWLSQV